MQQSETVFSDTGRILAVLPPGQKRQLSQDHTPDFLLEQKVVLTPPKLTYLPPSYSLRYLNKGVSSVYWQTDDLPPMPYEKPVTKRYRKPESSSFGNLFPMRSSHLVNVGRELLKPSVLTTAMSHEEYEKPIKLYNHRADDMVDFREALLRVAALGKPKRNGR